MSKEFTCGDCAFFSADEDDEQFGVCRHGGCSYSGKNEICANFRSRKDYSRPRFCRLASSVDEMAKAMVFRMGAFWTCNVVKKIFDSEEDALAAAKDWLMSVEDMDGEEEDEYAQG